MRRNLCTITQMALANVILYVCVLCNAVLGTRTEVAVVTNCSPT